MTDIRAKLVHAVTRYDRARENKPGHNIYALGHYLGAVDRIMARIDGSRWTVRKAIVAHTNGSLLDACLKAVGEQKATREEQHMMDWS